jgi:DNA-binding transcriptional MerR regulator
VKETRQRTYTIGQVAALTGVSVKAIRFYHRAGVLKPADTTAGGYRLFTQDEIWRLELIRVLRHLGFGIPEIRQMLDGQVSVHQAVTLQLAAVDERIRQLERLRAALRRVKTRLDAGDSLPALLHAIKEAIHVNTQEQVEFVRQTVSDIVTGAAPPDTGWDEPLRIWVQALLPEPASPDQVAAVQELARLLADADFARHWRAAMAAFWAEVRRTAVDPARWGAAWQDLVAQAAAAADAGATPSSPETQALLTQWMEILARELGQPLDAPLWTRFTKIAAMPEQIAANQIGTDTSRRFWEQLEQVSPALARLKRGGRLLLEGLRWRLQQSEPTG